MTTRRQLISKVSITFALALLLALPLGLAAPQHVLADEADLVGAPSSTLGLENGLYTIEVKLEGGSGRATIESPTRLEVYEGRAYVVITWSSPNFDYMKVDGKKYLPTNMEGNSSFELPIDDIDEPLKVVADTTAMSKPHEIKYTLSFDRDSIKREFRPSDHVFTIVGVCAGVAFLLIIFIWSRQMARRISGEQD